MTASRISPLFIALLILAVAAGTFFRLHNLGTKVYWNDEMFTSLWISGHTYREFEATVPVNAVFKAADLLKYQRRTPGRGLDRSIGVLTEEDPKQPALYLALVRLWTDVAGDSPGAVRLFSAIVSLLVLPAVFWLFRELPADRAARNGGGWLSMDRLPAWTAVLLFAVSPFQILYGQEARPYSLWMLLLILSGAALLRALRRGVTGDWILYGAMVAAGLYSHTLFALVLAGHVIHVALVTGRKPGDETPANRPRRAFALALGGGMALFLPWALLIVLRMGELKANTSWVAGVTGYPTLVTRLALSFCSPFMDPGVSHGAIFRPSAGGFTVAALAAAFLTLVVASLAHVWKWTGARVRSFVFTTIGPTVLVLVLPDLVLGGCGITTARFLLPALAGFQVAVVLLVSALLVSGASPRRMMGYLTLAALAVAGIVSSARSDRAESWWHKYINVGVPPVARAIHAAPRPLVLGDDSGIDLNRLVSLVHKLEPRVDLLLVRDAREIVIPEGYSDIFWYGGRSEVKGELIRAGYRMEANAAGNGLWNAGVPEAGTRVAATR